MKKKSVELLRQRERCALQGKPKYSKKDALTVVNRRKSEGEKLRAYQCHVCNMWHLTHQELFEEY